MNLDVGQSHLQQLRAGCLYELHGPLTFKRVELVTSVQTLYMLSWAKCRFM
jgi:hypothetical protein